MIVTFIYKLPNDMIYYGKYIGYITDNYEYGLDLEIKTLIYPIIKKKYNINKSELYVGILSSDRKNYEFFSIHEKNIFNILYNEAENKIYFNGEKIDYHIEFDGDNTEPEDDDTEPEDIVQTYFNYRMRFICF